ncbi:hypothetical protein FHR81_002968 [Actinoalloteichus hoggarensis]|uniref:Uncharacterized protein n=1 Tax=Actinoalloteichus hoggarensis TaxID=1470176 RepID=A0A221VYE5_9PSEU|nr:hypothetical protein AHOG_04520 [Actinoalloteichus hoggarensis]MBB5921928.1 hypothetical protein [Actinoalloteichus hoggarensis]
MIRLIGNLRFWALTGILLWIAAVTVLIAIDGVPN